MYSLQEKEVAITGQLASMTRGEAVLALSQAGGRYTQCPTPRTSFLVVGHHGKNRQVDLAPTRSLIEAQKLQKFGQSIRLIGEEEFLSELGVERQKDRLHRFYTIFQLSRILDVSVADLRRWVRAGLLQPVRIVGRLCFFDFPQIATGKALRHLIADGVGLSRIAKSLQQLRRWSPDESISPRSLAMATQGGNAMIENDDGHIIQADGQMLFNFHTTDQHPAEPQQIASRSMRAGQENLFDRSVSIYQRTTSTGSPNASLCFRLGKIFYRLNRKNAAARQFGQVVRMEPGRMEAWNHLGNTLVDLNRLADAIISFRRTLLLAPNNDNAHYKLAETLFQIGRTSDARHHWQRYLELKPLTPRARHAHARLEQTEQAPPARR
ncbi:MAG: tetratricopeptide repeat protein [Planctomycetota bacterium]|nr:tetratricopeptide repeat protein [Planctomycetota bacterium]